MNYSPNVQRAAYRHLEAANALAPTARADVAGYLYGIAAECAVKAMLPSLGIFPLEASKRRDDPYFAHFPELRTMLRDQITGRHAATLLRFINDDSFMSHWSITMRYAQGSDILPQWVKAWSAQARQIVGSMDT